MAVDILKKQTVGKLPNDLDGMEASMQRLLSLVDSVYNYVDNVVVSKSTGSLIISHLNWPVSDLKLFILAVPRKGMFMRTVTWEYS